MSKRRKGIKLGITAGILLVAALGSLVILKDKKSKRTISSIKAKNKNKLLTIGKIDLLNKPYRDLDNEDLERIVKLIKTKGTYRVEEKEFIEKNIVRIVKEIEDGEKQEEAQKDKPVKRRIAKEIKKPLTVVYRTKSGRKYHRETCSNLNTKIKISLPEAKEAGLTPCMVCKPEE